MTVHKNITNVIGELFQEFLGTSWQGKATAVIGVLAAIAIAVGLILHFTGHPAKVAMEAARAQGSVIETTVTAKSAESAIQAVDHQAQDLTATATIQTENDHAIQALPSAATGIPDADADAWKRGLCRYAEADADPECARLR